MKLNKREKRLITTALYILECQFIADELHPEIESELGSVTEDDLRDLMDKIEDK